MAMSKAKIIKGLVIAGLVITVVGCSPKETNNTPEDKSTVESQKPADEGKETGVKVIDLDWSAQPKLGITKGDYYRIEERFRQGHLGILEVVKSGDEIVHVEFNEMTRPNYYHRYFQNVPKRMSEYNFDMGEKKGAAWIQSVVQVENQMLEEQRITGEFDVVSGASNSINQAMIPMAEKLAPSLDKASNEKYYSIAEDLGEGLTGSLKVVLRDKKIVSVEYDEIFADSPDEITDKNLKQYYRQSKYDSVEYEEPSRIGFNVQMDALNDKVVETQDLLDLTGLPSTEQTGDYAKSGFTVRNTAWDNYLRLAEKLITEMKNDGNF